MKHAVRLGIVVAVLALISLIMLTSSRDRGEPVTLHLLGSTNDPAGNMIGMFSVSNHYDHFIRVLADSNGLPVVQLAEHLKAPGKSNALVWTNYIAFPTGRTRLQPLASGAGMEFSVIVPNGVTNARLNVSYLRGKDHLEDRIEKLLNRARGTPGIAMESVILRQPFVQEPIGQ